MATANEWAAGRASKTGGGDINAWAGGLAKQYGYTDDYFKKLDAEKARKKVLEPKVNSYRDGFFNGAITEEARNGILTSLKKRAETGDELAIERFNAIVEDQRINQAAPGIAPNLSGMQTISKGLVEGVASAYTRLGRGVGQTINQKTGGNRAVEQTSQALNTQTVQLISKYGQQLKDPNVSPEQKQRIRKSLDVISKNETLRNTQIGKDAQQLIDDTDPVKGAAAVAEIGLDIATLGTGGAAIKTAKSGGRVAAGKILRGSLEGAGAGLAGTVQQRGSETTGKDLAIGGTLGAAFGATLPAVGYGLTNAKKAVPSIFESKFGQAIANTSAGQKISQAKSTMGRVFVDDTNHIKKQFGNDVEVGGTWKVKDRIDHIITNIRNSGVLADSTLQEDPSWKQLSGMFDNMSKKDGRALKKSFGEFINKKQDAINNNKLVTDGRIDGKLVAVPKGTPEQELAYNALNSSTKPVVQRMFDEGRITKAKYDSWINDTDYTRVQREIDETLGEEFARGGGFSPSAKGVSDQKLKGSTKQAVDPFAAHIDWSRKVQRELEQNKLTKYLRDQSLAKGITKPLRVADKVIQRIELYGEAAQLRPLRNKIGRAVKAQGQYVRRIQSELDKLNKAGLDEALKNGGKEKMPDFTPGGMGGDVPTAKTGKSTTDFVQGTRGTVKEPSKQIDRLSKKRDQLINEAESLSPSRKPEPGMLPANPTKAKELRAQAKAIQKKIDDIQRKIQPKAVDAATAPSKLSKAESDRFINSLIEEDPAKLKAIRKKIGNREPKLAQALDEMIALSDQYKTTKYEVNNLIERARSQELADLDPAGEKTMGVFENGIRELYTVDPAVAKQLKSISDTNLGAAGQAFLATSKVLRLGATALNAAFAIPNFIMDQTFSFAMSKNKFATHNPIALVHSMWETAAKPLLRGANDRVPGARNAITGLLEPSDAYKAWASKNKYMTRTDLARQLKAATRQSDEMLGVRGEGALRKFEGVISSLEETTRFQNYLGTLKKMSKDKNLSREEIAAMADEASRKNSVNFSSHGEMNQFLQIFNPYINAGVQGAKTLGNSLKERPVSTGLAITASTLLPVGMSTYYNLGDPKRAQIYANIPERERENNVIFITDSGAVVKMPIPVSFRPFAKPVRNYIESQYLGDRQGLLETAKNLLLDPFNPLGTTKNEALANTIPQFIKPVVEVGMNKDLYFGSEVVPESLQGLPKEEQAYANTPEIYKTIGKKLGMSPLQLRKLVTGYTAGGGEGALVNIDALRGEETGGRSAAEQVAARFYKSPGNQGSQVKSTFYETYKPLRQKKDAYSGKITDAVKAGDMDKANKMAQMINDEVEKEKERLRTKYGRYETDLTVLYDQMDNLKLPMENGRLTDRSIQARSK